MLRRFIQQLFPFVLLGFAITAFVFGIFLLAYLLMIGALVGLTLFSLNWIKNKLFPPKMPSRVKKQPGRVIESKDWKEL